LNIVSVQILSIAESVGGTTSSVSNLPQILIIHRPSNVPQLGQSLALGKALLRVVIGGGGIHLHALRSCVTLVTFKMLYVNFMEQSFPAQSIETFLNVLSADFWLMSPRESSFK
jgi:hypothetical protein